MALIQGNTKVSAGGYTIDQSIRFNDNDSAYMSRTSGATGDRQKWTFSAWVKRGTFYGGGGANSNQRIFHDSGNNNWIMFGYNGVEDVFRVYLGADLRTTALFRDASSWYHMVVAVDTTQATSSERVKIYQNGVQITSFSASGYPSLNYNTIFNNSGTTYQISGHAVSEYFDGYISEFHWIDGQALAPTDFGETNDDGVWVPKAYEGTYGTNGFYITGEDSADLGADYSGNGNDFTSSGLTSDDQVSDSPTDNYSTANPLSQLGTSTCASTFSDGNLTIALATGSNHSGFRSTIAVDASDDSYMEITYNTHTGAGVELGIVSPNVWASSGYVSSINSSYPGDAYGYRNDGQKMADGSTSAYGDSFTAGDVIGMRLNAGSLYFYKNGTIQNSGTALKTGLTGTWNFGASHRNNTGGTENITLNFGQSTFGNLPTGSAGWSTANLPEPAIADGSNNFNSYTWTGNGGGQRIASFQSITETYTIDNSARFNDNDSAYLSKTLSTPTNNLQWTWSAWVKRGNLGSSYLFNGGDGSSNNFGNLQFLAGDGLQFSQINGGSYNVQFQTTQVYKDSSAWYHIVLVYDSANATAADRLKIYVNGALQAGTYVTGPFAQSTASKINSAIAHYVGKLDYSALYYDGYMADVHFIDGQALAASDFGQYDSSTNRWIPKAYSGGYGTNGFFLEFGDSAALGDDTSGNANDFTSSGLASTDQMLDTPTKNYATLDPNEMNPAAGVTLKDGNLNADATATATDVNSTLYVTSGKWYVEYTINAADGATSNPCVGIQTQSFATSPKITIDRTGSITVNGTTTSLSGFSYTTSDIVMIAFDMDADKFWIGKNGTWYNSGDPANGTGETTGFSPAGQAMTPYIRSRNSSDVTINFGQSAFSYTAPTGFNQLNTDNLPLTGGNTSAFSWIKSRSTTYNHQIYDRVRGPEEYLSSNTNSLPTTDTNGLQTFLLDGFQLGSSSNVNASGQTYVGWNWMTDTSGSGSSNTDGTITSTVLADQTAGFSIVKYSGNGTSGATVGHGINAAPKMLIVKTITSLATDWPTYHIDLTPGYSLYLNTTGAENSFDNWASTAPTSSVFTLSTSNYVNNASRDYIAYCFAEVEGFSKIGSYTGNGSTDGSFVWCGFRPAWVLIKATTTKDWPMQDTTRDPYNVADKHLFANLSVAEYSDSNRYADYLSNGFKLRTAHNAVNTSGQKYIFMAFAEHPFGGDGVAPVPAR